NQRVSEVSGRFWRRRRRQTAEAERADERTVAVLLAAARRVVVVGRAVARELRIPVDVELVARRGLIRQTAGEDFKTLRAFSDSRLIGTVEILTSDAGVQVWKHTWNRAVLAFVSGRHVEPQLVLLDRTAFATREVPVEDFRPRRRETGRLQRGRVVALHPAAR